MVNVLVGDAKLNAVESGGRYAVIPQQLLEEVAQRQEHLPREWQAKRHRSRRGEAGAVVCLEGKDDFLDGEGDHTRAVGVVGEVVGW